MELELKLTVEETNIILLALSSQPYNKVVTLIGKIKQSAEDQLKPEPKLKKSK